MSKSKEANSVEIVLFVEDTGHRLFIGALIRKVAQEFGRFPSLSFRSATRGRGTVVSQLEKYIRDISIGLEVMPKILVIAVDSNCKGLQETKKILSKKCGLYSDISIFAIPDPHIERWMLLDSGAFKSVFGKGCSAPDQKCEKDRYKVKLLDAIIDAGHYPSASGMERAEDVVENLNLSFCEERDESFKIFLKDLRRKFETF
jgi:hypothetical protein